MLNVAGGLRLRTNMMTSRAKIGLAVFVMLVIVYLVTPRGPQPGGYQPASVTHVKNLLGVKDEHDDPIILKIVRSKGISYNLAGVDIKKMSASEREHTMHSVLDNTDTVCKRKLRMGKLGDGGWEICDDVDVRPKRPCVVYSFGIANDFSFDDDTALNYGCHVYSFDPSMDVETHNRSDLVHFYKIGLSGRSETRGNWQLYTFSDIRQMLGHQRTQIDVVKIDIENSEWTALKNMAATGELRRFKQMLLEFHLVDVDVIKDYHVEVAQIMELEGFRKFYSHKNPACERTIEDFPGKRTLCYEVHYVRRPSEVLV